MVTYFSRIGAVLVACSAMAVAHAQDRIVSLGGDVTEIVYALGAGDRIVATDTTSVYPLKALATPKVGYVRQLSAEGVLSVDPDLILISGAAGPETTLEQIRGTGVAIVEMETAYTIEAIKEKTRKVAEAIGDTAAGEELVAQIEADWTTALEKINSYEDGHDMLFFATFGDNAPRAAGRDTAAHGVIELIGGNNVFGSETGYKSLSLEAAVAADPDIILVMDMNAVSAGGVEELINHPAISLTTAAQTRQVFEVDAVRAMQFSPRTPKAIEELADKIEAQLSADG
ncbi:MAG: ABC transporter substrate-binding protein [Pseudomonadota bacterium]